MHIFKPSFFASKNFYHTNCRISYEITATQISSFFPAVQFFRLWSSLPTRFSQIFSISSLLALNFLTHLFPTNCNSHLHVLHQLSLHSRTSFSTCHTYWTEDRPNRIYQPQMLSSNILLINSNVLVHNPKFCKKIKRLRKEPHFKNSAQLITALNHFQALFNHLVVEQLTARCPCPSCHFKILHGWEPSQNQTTIFFTTSGCFQTSLASGNLDSFSVIQCKDGLVSRKENHKELHLLKETEIASFIEGSESDADEDVSLIHIKSPMIWPQLQNQIVDEQSPEIYTTRKFKPASLYCCGLPIEATKLVNAAPSKHSTGCP